MRVSSTFLSIVLASLMCGSAGLAHAEWKELSKDDDVAYYFDDQSVMPVHVSRYAWTLVDLSRNDKAPNGESYKSAMIRWRMYCKTDMVVPLSVSFFDQQMGKGKEVAREDVHEWRLRETPIRPNTYLASLKKEICVAPRPASS